MRTGLLRWTVRIHKWIALIIGVQILIWILGGFVFSVLDIHKVRGEHKIAPRADAPIYPSELMSLAGIAEKSGIESVESAEVAVLLGEPVWRITVAGSEGSEESSIVTLDGRTGERLSPIGEALARKIALADYAGRGELQTVEYVTDPPTEYPHPGAAWLARFDDRDKTTLYINPDSAEVKSRRSQTWRVFDFFWKLHVMDYDDGESFNHPLLIAAAFLALFVAGSGLVLLFIKIRRLILRRKRLSQHL